MKKLLALLLAAVMCISVFAACTPGNGGETTGTDTESETESGTTPGTQTPASDVDAAAAYVKGMYKTKDVGADFDVVSKVVLDGVTYTVTWTADTELVKITASATDGFVTVDVPVKNETALEFKLTATVSDASGKTASAVLDRTLIVYDLSAFVGNPDESTAYKFFFIQVGLKQTLFANGETDNDKYLKTTTDAKEAPDFFVEKDGQGFKFYTHINDKKMYVKASTVNNAGKISKYISYSETEGTTWIYKADVNAWFTTIDNLEYVVGTYGTYNTFSISDASFMKPDTSGVTQFPGGLMLKEAAEEMTATEVVIYNTPAEIVNAVYALNVGDTLSGGYKYTLTGTVTEIPSPYDAGYGNATFVIVVEGLTDKPIECFRIKGDGVENVKVGDKITVSGQLLKYDNKTETGKVEFNSGCTLDAVNGSTPVVTDKPAQSTAPAVTDKPADTDNNTPAGTSAPETTTSEPDNTTTTEPDDNTTTDPSSTPKVGKAYKLMVNHETVGKTLYFAGTTANREYYLASTEDVTAAVDVYLEAVTGGYKLYFTINGTKTYFSMKQNGTYYNTGLVTSVDDAAVFTWNTEFNTLVSMTGDSLCYLGMYGTYETFSASKITYAGQTGSFTSQLVTVG